MCRKLTVAIACSFMLGACSPNGDTVPVESAEQAEVASEKETQSSPVEPVMSTATFDFLGGKLDVPFDFELRYDRVRATESHDEQRQILLEVTDRYLNVETIGERLQRALEGDGFSSEYVRLEDGVLRAKFSIPGAPSIFALVRPDGVGPTLRNEDAVASLYLTQVRDGQ